MLVNKNKQSESVSVRVTYLGSLADILNVRFDYITLPKNEAYVKNLLKHLLKLRPKLKEIEERIPLIQVFINGVEALPTTPLKEGDEVTLIPALYEGG